MPPFKPSFRMDCYYGELKPGQFLESLNGRFRLIFQTDGNLVLTLDGKPLWATNTSSTSTSQRLELSAFGELMIVDEGSNKWSSNATTYKDPDCWLELHDDGNAVVYAGNGALWSTQTRQEGLLEKRNTRKSADRLEVDECLLDGESLVSPNGKYSLTIQIGGDLVLLDGPESYWAADVSYVVKVVMEGNHNLVAYNQRGEKMWSSGTNGQGKNGYLALRDDGAAVIVSDGKETWTTGARPKKIDKTRQLEMGQCLFKTDHLVSPNGKVKLVFQDDGTLVLREGARTLWATNTTGAGKVVMQNDGNLVILNWDEKVRWASGTSANGSSNLKLVVLDDGEARIVSGAYTLWTTTAAAIDRLGTGEVLGPKQFLTSPNRKFTLVFQEDYNLVLYEGDNALWSSNTRMFNILAGQLTMSNTDNLVIGSNISKPVWASGTARRFQGGNAALVLKDDGDAVIISDGVPIWSMRDRPLPTAPAPSMDPVQLNVERIPTGRYLPVDQPLRSRNSQYTVTLQKNGNILLRRSSTGAAFWTSNCTTSENDTKMLAVGLDRNLIVYGSNSRVIWTSNTRNWREGISDPPYLQIEDNGNFAFRRDAGRPIWNSNTNFLASTAPTTSLGSGQFLASDQSLVSENGNYELTFTEAGHLAIRDVKQGVVTYYYTNDKEAKSIKYLRMSSYPVLDMINGNDGMVLGQMNYYNDVMKNGGKRERTCKLVLHNEGNAQIVENFSESGQIKSEVIWDTIRIPCGTDPLWSNRKDGVQTFLPGWELRDQSQQAYIRFKDGKLRIGRLTDEVWSVGDGLGAKLVLNHDGNLVMFDSRGTKVWESTGTSTPPAKGRRIQYWITDLQEFIIAAGDEVVWASPTKYKVVSRSEDYSTPTVAPRREAPRYYFTAWPSGIVTERPETGDERYQRFLRYKEEDRQQEKELADKREKTERLAREEASEWEDKKRRGAQLRKPLGGGSMPECWEFLPGRA